ncbi:MAG: dTMP kinase [Hydrogenophaga sp.]|nr:dTMP kinase [Hydrogenophaga sp.]
MNAQFSAPRGLFISFEGIDGAGKSTHIEGLAKAFRDQGSTVTLTREPGGTPLAEKLRAMVLGDAMDPLTESLLVFAGRRDHLMAVIEPALARGEVVICDRFTDATFAYQGGGRGFDLEVLSTLERWVQSTPMMEGQRLRQPDLTIWFDLSPETAAARLSTARAPDRFEAQPLEFFQRVVAGYKARVEADPGRFARVEADTTRERVWQQLSGQVVQRGWLTSEVAARHAPA